MDNCQFCADSVFVGCVMDHDADDVLSYVIFSIIRQHRDAVFPVLCDIKECFLKMLCIKDLSLMAVSYSCKVFINFDVS